jgi:PIN domain nuclease of toxin-antitoxin system
VRLLLDTHVLVWWLGEEPLSGQASEAIARGAVFVSAATVWEAEIKNATGKLEVRGNLLEQIHKNDFSELPVRFEHGREAARLPFHHRDPFDRMLAAQARVEGLTLVTRDPAFRQYEVKLLAA